MTSDRLEDYFDRIRPGLAPRLLLWTIAAFLAVFLVWAAFAQVDRTVRAMGRVDPTSRLQVVSNLEGGIVEAILVKTGDLVTRGQPLVRLDQTTTGSEYSSNRARFEALAARIARLQAEVEGRNPSFPAGSATMAEQVAIEEALHASRMADLHSLLAAANARMVQAERAVSEALASQQARSARAESARSELNLIRPLVEKGIEPRLSLIQAENAYEIAQSEAAAAAAAASRARSAVAEARAGLNQQREDWRARAAQELAEAQGQLVVLRRTLPALSERVDRTVIRAPVAGRVNRVLVTTVGGSVQPGAPLAEIVPSEESLYVEAKVRPQDIAWIHLAQPARVSITAYESAVYGSLHGRVISISPDAVVEERTGESHYSVRIATEGKLVDGRGKALAIGPGMVAEVALLGDKRSVLSYLLTPITRVTEAALREP